MRKLRLAGVAGLATAAFAIPTSTAYADTFVVTCPDRYQPVPAAAVPPDKKDKNRNGNLFVCAKGPQGSNQHFNVKDDKGEVVPPTQWSVNVIGTTTWVVTYALDPNSSYTLDQVPQDVVDDILP